MARKKIDYASLFTLRKDGRYMGYWRDKKDVRHAIYDRDPEALYKKIQDKESGKGDPLLFREVAEEWAQNHLEKVSRGTRSSYIKPYERLVEEFGDTPVADIGVPEITAVLTREKERGYSYKHAATVKSVFKQILDVALADRQIASNPATLVKVPRGLTANHIEAPETDIVDIISENFDKPFGDFVAMLFYTGMRTEEAAALTWGDVGKDFIRVRDAVDLHGTPFIKEAKTDAGVREVPILSKLRPYLAKPAGAKETDYIFNENGKLLTRGQITARWKKWCRLAGLSEPREYICHCKGGKDRKKVEWKPLVQPHQLRHNYATVLYEQKVDLLTTKNIMGHKDIQTTQKIYTSLRKKHRDEEIAKISAGF